MNMISRLSRLMIGALLCVAAPAFANFYQSEFRDCNITNIGPNKWQATFFLYIRVTTCTNCAETTDNTFRIGVPQLNKQGLPTADTYVTAGWENLTLTGTAVKTLRFANVIYFSSTDVNRPDVIRGDSRVTVNFTTEGNNAYPALFIRYANLSTGGGTASAYLFVLPNSGGNCYVTTTPPIEELLPPPEPEFSLKSAVWELNPLDMADLPNVAAAGNGYAATIKNIGGNNLCLSYVTNGVKNKNYSLGVTNSGGNFSGRNLLMMNGAAGSQLPYSLQLNSNDGVTGNNYSFPSGGVKYITLKQDTSGTNQRSEMCWTPAVNLFKTSTTQEGLHSDTVNFIITPNA